MTAVVLLQTTELCIQGWVNLLPILENILQQHYREFIMYNWFDYCFDLEKMP